jgi:4,5-dihydroxyphthalate decarboxylase
LATYRLSVACRHYDRTAAILRGDVEIPGVELLPLEKSDVPAMFAGLFRGDYDVSEMSLAELAYFRSRGVDDFVAIPVFPYRMFRHGYIFFNTSAGISGPGDIGGKRVAIPRLVLTAGVWMRGLLTEEYGVSAVDTSWHYGAIHHWASESDEVTPRDGSTLRWLPGDGSDANQAAEQAVAQGDADVLCTVRVPEDVVKGEGRMRRLFEAYPDVEAEYFRSSGIFPIMHAIAIRRPVAEAHPELPEQLFRAFVEAKSLSNRILRADASLSLVWKDHYLQRERDLFEADPWEYGLRRNRHVVAKFLAYCYDQGVSSRALEPEDLFAPSTLELAE